MSLLPKLNPFMVNIRQFSVSSCFLKTSPAQGEIPKRPSTPWTSYYTAKFPNVKEKNPTLPTSEIMRMISGNWKKVPDDEKDRLQKIYLEQLKSYQLKLEQLPQGVLERAKELKKEKKDMKKERKEKKSLELQMKQEKKERQEAANELRKLEEGKPKRNLSAYLLYSQDRRPQLADSMKSAEKMRVVANEWNGLRADLREKYEKKAVMDKERYTRELEAWKEKAAAGTEEQIVKLKKLSKNKK